MMDQQPQVLGFICVQLCMGISRTVDTSLLFVATQLHKHSCGFTSELSLVGRRANQQSCLSQGTTLQRAAGLPSSSTVSRTSSPSPQLRRAVFVSALVSFTEAPKPVLCTYNVLTRGLLRSADYWTWGA